jgi:hypothetical protein
MPFKEEASKVYKGSILHTPKRDYTTHGTNIKRLK